MDSLIETPIETLLDLFKGTPKRDSNLEIDTECQARRTVRLVDRLATHSEQAASPGRQPLMSTKGLCTPAPKP